MNYAFYVSNKANRLKKIIRENNNFLNDVSLVFSECKSTKYLEKDLKNIEIDYILYDYSEIKQKDKNLAMSNELLQKLINYKIDYCFSFGSHILKGKILDVYKNKIINFHPSLLPSFPGQMAIDQALDAGAKILGNTAHFIDEGIDTGPIIMQNILSKEIYKTHGYDGILDNQIPMLYKIYDCLENDKIKIKNRNVTIENANYRMNTFFPEINDN